MDSNSKSDGLDDKMKSQIRNPDYLQWVHLLEDTIPLVMPKNRRQTVIQEEWTLEKSNSKRHKVELDHCYSKIHSKTCDEVLTSIQKDHSYLARPVSVTTEVKNESLEKLEIKELKKEENIFNNNNNNNNVVETKETSLKVFESSSNVVVDQKFVKNSKTESFFPDNGEECCYRLLGKARSSETCLVKGEEQKESPMEVDDTTCQDFNAEECQISDKLIGNSQESFIKASDISTGLNMPAKDVLPRHQDRKMNLDQDDEDELSEDEDDAELFELVKRDLELRRQYDVVPQQRDCWVNPYLLLSEFSNDE